MNNPDLQLTVEDIAYILGVTRATIYNRQRSGDLPPGTGLDVVRSAIANEEKRIADMRSRLSEKVTERLVMSV